MTNNSEELNKSILRVFDYRVESTQSFNRSKAEFERDFNPVCLEVIKSFIANCTIDDFERLKLIASNYEVTNNF